MSGDEAYYFKHDGNELKGMVLTQVDDFLIAGKPDFLDSILEKISSNLTFSKVENDHFRFNGIDIKKTGQGIAIRTDDYAESIEEIAEIRKAKKTEQLSKLEMKLYRKMTGKLSWLAANARPDLAITALSMSKKNNNATIADLKNINNVVKRIKSKENKVIFSKIGEDEDFVIHGLGDASYKYDNRSIGGVLVLLGNKNTKDVVPLYWKSKVIPQVCHSAKDAETRNVLKLVDDSKHLAVQLEELLFDSAENKIPVRLYTDSKPTLETIASTRQIERKLLRNIIADSKSKLEDGPINSYYWLE